MRDQTSECSEELKTPKHYQPEDTSVITLISDEVKINNSPIGPDELRKQVEAKIFYLQF